MSKREFLKRMENKKKEIENWETVCRNIYKTNLIELNEKSSENLPPSISTRH